MLEALGMIEVTGYLGAISAADAALKAANVRLLKSEKVKGGITTVELIGDVAAITAAVDAGKMAAEQLNCLRSSHVIARMDPAVQSMLLDTKEPKISEEQLENFVEEKIVAKEHSIEAPAKEENDLKENLIKSKTEKKAKKSQGKKDKK